MMENVSDDSVFLTNIITQICDYAVENDMEPNETLKIVCENILALTEISNFNGWKKGDRE